MKHRIAALVLIMMLVGSCPAVCPAVNATTDEHGQADAIQNHIDKTLRITRAPGISAMVLNKGQTYFYSSGLANLEKGMPADEDTLYSLASVSKAFTALGILYLEEQGLLSLDDPVGTYLPWFQLQYRGQDIDMQEVKLYHFLHHTSGLTNRRHTNHIEIGRTVPDTLRDGVELLNGADLAFYPGERHEYGTVNYNVLGLVIESVSGQSFEYFMEENIFRPLGLTSTFANQSTAEATGLFAQGYKREFALFRSEFDPTCFTGMAPTGYISSSAKDMGRWMSIQLGIAEDIPDVFKEIVPRAFEPGNSIVNSDGSYYAAGWEVSADGAVIEHGGNNSGGNTHAVFFPNEQTAIVVLSNIGMGNTKNTAENIKSILGGNLRPAIILNIFHIVDIALTIAVIACILLAPLFLFQSRRMKKRSPKELITRKKWGQALLSDVIVGVVIIIALPRVMFGFAASWQYALTLVSYSFLAGSIAITVLSFSYTWYKLSKKEIDPTTQK